MLDSFLMLDNLEVLDTLNVVDGLTVYDKFLANKLVDLLDMKILEL